MVQMDTISNHKYPHSYPFNSECVISEALLPVQFKIGLFSNTNTYMILWKYILVKHLDFTEYHENVMLYVIRT